MIGKIRNTARQMLISFDVPNYRLLFTGRVTSNMGRTMRVFARAWYVYELTESPLRMGIATSALTWPMLIMPLFGGIVADRVDRKKLLIYTESILVILWVIVAVLITIDIFEWWYFIISAVISGIVQSFGRPGHQAMIGSIVDSSRLGNAVALDSVSETWPRIVAPALGAILIGIIGIDGLFWLTAFAQFITLITLIKIRWVPLDLNNSRKMGNNILEAIQHIRKESIIVALVALGLLSSLFAGSYNFLLPIFADDILGVGETGLGILMTVGALGGALGSIIVVAASNAKRGRGMILISISIIKTIALVAFSQAHIFPIAMAAMFFMGSTQVMFMTMLTIAMQQLSPDHLRGRIMSLRVIFMGFSPFGVLIMGTIAELHGASSTVLVGALLYGATSLLVLMMIPTLRRFQ